MVLVDASTMTEEPVTPKKEATTVDPLSIIDKLVFSGGGLKGAVHVGVVRFLEEKNVLPRIHTVAGTSIGALVATLLTLSYTSAEMETHVKQFDYLRYQSVDIKHFIKCFGLDNFEKIMEYIATFFTKKKFNPYVTFHDLFTITNKHLIINAVCLNTHENKFFDYCSTPQMPVIIALRASMTIPFMFGSVTYNGLTYVDGGVLCNFAINHPRFKENPETVLGVDIGEISNCSVRAIDSIEDYLSNLITCLYDYVLLQQPEPQVHVLRINSNKCSVFNLTICTDEKLALIQLGYNKVVEYFMGELRSP